GFARIRIAPTWATASVRIVGGITAAPLRDRERYHSSIATFLMPTIRLSGSSSMMRSTRRNGKRWGRIRSIAALSSGSVRSIARKRLYFGSDRRHGSRSGEIQRPTDDALRARPRGGVRARSRRAPSENPRAHLTAHQVHGVRDVSARSEAERADRRLLGRISRGRRTDAAAPRRQRPGQRGG